jgi:hypothetical protein
MAERKDTQPNWPLILPIGLLIIELIVFVVMRLTSFTISEYLFYFLILLGFYLLYQIGKQLLILVRVRGTMKKLSEAKHFAESGHPLKAIREWKKLLLQLPKKKYLEVLASMEETYQALGMMEAVRQTKNVHSESIEFFALTGQDKRPTNNERKEWQLRANEIRKMIKDLPEEEI